MVRSNLVSISVGYPNLFNVKLTNTQNVDTPSPFQQMLQLPVSQLQSYTPILASDFHNIRFVYNGTGVPAWLESISNGVATIWVNVPVSIPANSSVTIDMEVDPSLNFDGNYWGENPLLSPTYGGYDNAASVFNFYDNFAGATLNSHWSVIQSSATTSINDGLTIQIVSGSSGYYIIYSTTAFAPPLIAENLFSTSTFANNLRTFNPTLSASNTQTTPAADIASSPVIDWSINSANSGVWNAQQGDSSAYYASPTGNINAASNWLLGVGYTGSTNYWYGFNGATQNNYYTYTSSSTDTPTGSLYLGLGARWTGVSAGINIAYTWVRIRAYPPNGVMPSVEVIA